MKKVLLLISLLIGFNIISFADEADGKTCATAYTLDPYFAYNFDEEQAEIYIYFTASSSRIEFSIDSIPNYNFSKITEIYLYDEEDCNGVILDHFFDLDSIDFDSVSLINIIPDNNYSLKFKRSKENLGQTEYFGFQMFSAFPPCIPNPLTCDNLIRNGSFDNSTPGSALFNSAFLLNNVCFWESGLESPDIFGTSKSARMWYQDFLGIASEGIMTEYNFESGKTYLLECSLKIDDPNIPPTHFNIALINRPTVTVGFNLASLLALPSVMDPIFRTVS